MTTNSSFISYFSFAKVFILCFAAISFVVFITVIAADPFNFFDLQPASRVITMTPFKSHNSLNDRYTANSMIKSQKYDSAILGSSVSFIIEAKKFNILGDSNFANLSMRAALPYEQLLVANRFAESVSDIKYMMFFLTDPWCRGDEDPTALRERGGPIQNEDFPLWLLDGNSWNNVFHIFHLKAFRYSLKKMFFLMKGGRFYSIYDREGSSQDSSSNYEKPKNEVLKAIYGEKGKRKRDFVAVGKKKRRRGVNAMKFSRIAMLEDFLSRLDGSVKKVLVISPRHYFYYPHRLSVEGAILKACKQRIRSIASNVENVAMIDFLAPGNLINNEDN